MIWTYLKYIRNPIHLVIGTTLKFVFKKLLFRNLDWKDYNELLKLSIDLIPAHNWYTMCKLLIKITLTPYNEVTQIDQIAEIVQNSVFNSTKTIKEIEEGSKDRSWKIFFISVIFGGLFRKSFALIRNFIILPFKIGTYLFMGGLVGIRVDQILHWFDFLKFNIPNWFYNKLLVTHINWLNWVKGVGQVDSLITKDLEELKFKSSPKIVTETSSIEELKKQDTFLYLNKNQWLLVLGIGIGMLLVCTGVYITYGWGDDSKGAGDSSLNVDNIKKVDKKLSDSLLTEKKLSDYKNVLESLKAPINTPVLDNISTTSSDEIEKALERGRANITWTEYFKNKINNLVSSKTTNIIDSPSSNISQIELNDMSSKAEDIINTPTQNPIFKNTFNAPVASTSNSEIITNTSNVWADSKSPIQRPFSPAEGDLGLKSLFSSKNKSNIPTLNENLSSDNLFSHTSSSSSHPLDKLVGNSNDSPDYISLRKPIKTNYTPLESFTDKTPTLESFTDKTPTLEYFTDKTPTQSSVSSPILKAVKDPSIPDGSRPLSPISDRDLEMEKATWVD